MPENRQNAREKDTPLRTLWPVLGAAVAAFLLLAAVLSAIAANMRRGAAVSAVESKAPPGVLPAATPYIVRAFPDTSDGIYVFNDQLATHQMSEAQFAFAATHYVGTQKVFASDVRRFRSGNPNFIILNYRLGMGLGYRLTNENCQPDGDWLEIIEGEKWRREFPDDPPDEWFYTIDGQRVLFCDWGWYLMDIANPSWQAYWEGEVFRQLQANAADGVFVDSLIPPNYYGGDRFSPPLPPADANFEQAWSARIENFIAAMQHGALAEYHFIPNVGEWVVSRDNTDYTAADGVMVEGFGRWTDGSYFAAEDNDWQLQMNRILQMVARDKILLLQQYVNATQTEDRLFLLGSYLLVKGKHTYINLELDTQPEWFPEYEIPIGTPIGGVPASISSLWRSDWGVYARAYSQGLVLVNPSDKTLSIVLGETYYRAYPLGGGIVPADGDVSAWKVTYTPVTHLNLAPHQAAILLHQPPK